MTSLLRQNNVILTSFWRNNDVFITSCVQGAVKQYFGNSENLWKRRNETNASSNTHSWLDRGLDI